MLYKFKGRKFTFECEGAIACLKKYKYSSIDFVLMNVIYQCADYHKHLSTCISDVAHLAMRASLINNVSAGSTFQRSASAFYWYKIKEAG